MLSLFLSQTKKPHTRKVLISFKQITCLWGLLLLSPIFRFANWVSKKLFISLQLKVQVVLSWLYIELPGILLSPTVARAPPWPI